MPPSDLSPPQIDWINKAAGAVPGMDAALAIETRKQELLDAAREKIDQSVGDIKVGENFQIDTLSGFLGRKITMASIGEDPNEEFDTGHDLKDVTGMKDPEMGKVFAQLMHAQSIVATEVEKLRRAQDTATRKPLFSDKEISEAVWAPLMRRKLIPENAIPDRYSEVARTFSGASGEYETRLSAYTDGLSKYDEAMQRLGIAKDVIDGLAGAASAVTGDLGALGVTKNPYEVAMIIKGVQTTLSGVTTVSKAILKEDGKLNKKNVESIAKDVVKSAQTLINASYSGGTSDEVNFGKAIAYGIGIAMSGPAVYVKIKDKKYVDILDDVADTIQGACTCFTYDVKSTGGTDTGPGGSGVMQYNEFGTAVAGAIKTFKTALVALFKDGDPEPADLLKILQQALQSGVDAGSTYKFDHNKSDIESQAKTRDSEYDKDNTSTETPNTEIAKGVIELEWQALRDTGATSSGFSAPEKLMKEVLAKGPAALNKLKKDDPALKAMQKFAETIAKQQKALQDAELQTFDAEMAEDEREFRDLLNRSETGDQEGDVEKIEDLVLQLKKDQMVIDLSLQLISLPAQAVAAFLPQAGIAVSAIELVKNIRKVAQHWEAYSEWRANYHDAQSAMSVQVEAMASRMNISRGKRNDEIASALENAAKIVAGAVSCAGPFAPAGHVVAATVSGVSTLRVLITKYVREAELKKAWKDYVSARENPDDRKTVRAAIRKNPTLAKYVIAWGAEVENDPVARSAMQKCGLTEEVLSNKNSNVQKVVTFLETLYPDDPVLLQPVQRPEEWYPGPVEFTSASFAAFSGAAESKADPPLRRGSGRGLITAMTLWEKQDGEYKTALRDWQGKTRRAGESPPPPNAAEDAQKALHALQVAVDVAERGTRTLVASLRTFKPATQDGEDHESFAAYVRMLVPTARAYAAKYRREAEALAEQDGALARDMEAGLAA